MEFGRLLKIAGFMNLLLYFIQFMFMGVNPIKVTLFWEKEKRKTY